MENDYGTSFFPLLLGGGRLARHLHHYLERRKIPHGFQPRSRGPYPDSFRAELDSHSHVWLLASDRALLELSENLRTLRPGLRLIHSSAATVIPGAFTLHPLMTFGPELYPLPEYERIPLTFFQEEWAARPALEQGMLSRFLESLPNPKNVLANQERVRYHASCVFASNFPLLLWEAARRAAPPSLDSEAFHPILEQTLENHKAHGIRALTGPLPRQDRPTIEGHLQMLAGSPEAEVYRAFLRYHESIRNPNPDSSPKEPPHADRA